MLGLHSHLFLIQWVCPSLAAHLDCKLQCEQSIPRMEEAIVETLLSRNVKNVEILHPETDVNLFLAQSPQTIQKYI